MDLHDLGGHLHSGVARQKPPGARHKKRCNMGVGTGLGVAMDGCEIRFSRHETEPRDTNMCCLLVREIIGNTGFLGGAKWIASIQCRAPDSFPHQENNLSVT